MASGQAGQHYGPGDLAAIPYRQGQIRALEAEIAELRAVIGRLSKERAERDVAANDAITAARFLPPAAG